MKLFTEGQPPEGAYFLESQYYPPTLLDLENGIFHFRKYGICFLIEVAYRNNEMFRGPIEAEMTGLSLFSGEG